MQRAALVSAFTALLATAGLAQSAVPQTGVCVHYDALIGASLSTTIKWSGNTATITTHSDSLTGQVVGLRPHDTRFKLSIFYDDPITGPSELVLFGITYNGVTKHRRAIIGYDILTDGTRVVSHVSGFEDINCSMLE